MQENRVFEHLVSYRDAAFTLTDSLPAIQVVGEIVSWDLFPLLGIQPERGRGFRPEEEQPGTHVAVLSHALWIEPIRRRRAHRRESDPHQRHAIYGGRRGPARTSDFRWTSPRVQLWVTLSEDATAADERGARGCWTPSAA